MLVTRKHDVSMLLYTAHGTGKWASGTTTTTHVHRLTVTDIESHTHTTHQHTGERCNHTHYYTYHDTGKTAFTHL